MKSRKPLIDRPVVLDEHMSSRYIELLASVYGVKAEKFEKGISDCELVDRLGNRNPQPILIGCDLSMSKNHLELNALTEYRLPYIVGVGKFPKLRYPEQVWRFVRYLPKAMAVLMEDPCILAVDFDKGRMKRYPYGQLLLHSVKNLQPS